MTGSQQNAEKAGVSPWRGARRVFAWLLLVLVVSGLAGALMIGRPVAAPVWLQERIEARLTQAVPGVDFSFGRMSLQMQRNGVARVILWDVELRNQNDDVIAHLADFEVGFSPLPLLVGQMELTEAQVSGAFLTVLRSRDGQLGLALGDVFEGGAMPGIPEMLTQVEAVFADPRFSELRLIEADALTLRYEDLRARRGWTVDGGRIRLERDADRLNLSADLALLSGGDEAASLELSAATRIGSGALDFGASFDGIAAKDIATQSPALIWLEALDAPMSGSLRSGVDAEGRLGSLNAVFAIGAGALAPTPATRPVPFDAARTYFTYDPDRAELAFSEIAVRSPLGQITATGKAQLQGPTDGWPTGLWGQFQLNGIELAEGAVLDRALSVSGAEMAFKLGFDPFEVTLGALDLADQDLPLQLSGRLLAAPDGWGLALDARAKRGTPQQVLSYWPEGFKPKARQWVAEHIKTAELKDTRFSLRSVPGQAPRTYLDIGFEQATVLYNKRLPEISEAAGRVIVDGARLAVRLMEGQIDPGRGGGITVAGSTFTIPDLRKQPGQAIIDLTARSSAEAALAFADNEAWRVLRKVGRDASLATGSVDMRGQIVMPLRRGLKLPDFNIDLTADLRNVRSGSLVPDRVLEARRLQLELTETAISVAGPVSLDGITGDGRWTQAFGPAEPGRVTAELEVTPDNLRRFGIELPNGMVSGAGRAQLELVLAKDAPPRFSLQSNLAGLGLSLPGLGWSLARSATGRFEVSGRAGRPVQIDRISLDAGGLRASGDLSLRPGAGLDVLTIDRLRIGNWLDAPVTVRGRGRGQAPEITLRGGRVDLRFATFGGGGGGGGAAGGGAPLKIALDSLQVSQGIILTRFAGAFETVQGLRGAFTAQIGTTEIEGEVLPSAGRSAFRITGEDAGDILRGAGVLKRVQDGEFKLDLAPVGTAAGTYDGFLTILGTRLQGGSAITGLLDAISIVGIIDQLNGPGIYFDEVEARFRLTPSQVTLERSSAVGPSMGISLDGYYDLASGEMDMQGVLSPIYLLNAIGRIFARKGEGLIGFNFNLTGAADDPRITVNPLSVFTPGMFRDIFRRPPPKLSQ